MRGRKPQPTALKLLRGNPGRRPLNPAEPQHPPLEDECPAELVLPEARAEWARVAPSLIQRGQVTTVDRGVLLGYCLKYGQWKALEDEAAKHAYIIRSPNNHPLPNPVLCLANKAFTLMLKSAIELGITPSARSRVSAQPVPDANISKWAGIK